LDLSFGESSGTDETSILLGITTEVTRAAGNIIFGYQSMSELSQTLEGTNLCAEENITTPHGNPNQSPKDYFTLYIKPYRQIFSIYATLHAPSKLHTKKLLSHSNLPYQTLLTDIITSIQNFKISKLSNYIDE
jgi:hypothetical protein